MSSSTSHRCYLIGEASLLIKCGDVLIKNGFDIKGIISNETKICEWAKMNGLHIIDPKSKYINKLKEAPFDYLFSIVNYEVMKKDVLDLPEIMPINFHDAILPRYGGIHATSWALLNGEKTHGITWHVMEEGIDTGDILKQKLVEIEDGETAFSLNLKCYSAAIEGFDELVKELMKGSYERKQQNSEERTYHGKYDKVENGGVIAFPNSAETIDKIVRALDFGEQLNRLGSAKLYVQGRFYKVSSTRILNTNTNVQPGTIIKLDDNELIIGTSTYDLALRLSTLKGEEIPISELAEINQLKEGDLLDQPDIQTLSDYADLYLHSSKYEPYWANRLLELEYPNLQDALRLDEYSGEDNYIEHTIKFSKSLAKVFKLYQLNDWEGLFLGICAFLARVGESQEFDIGLISSELKQTVKEFNEAFSSEIPCRLKINHQDSFRDFCVFMEGHLNKLKIKKTFSYEIVSRFPKLYKESKKGNLFKLPIAIEAYHFNDKNILPDNDMIIKIDCVNFKGQVLFNEKVYDSEKTKKLLDRIPIFLSEVTKYPNQPIMKTNILSSREYKKIVIDWNSKIIEYPKEKCTYQLIEEQAKKTPKNIAVIYEGNQITYEELNQRADQLANYLKTKGISENKLIGVFMERSIDLMIALIGIWKAECAYVPLDPIYPKDRLQHMIEEARIPLIITQSDLVDRLPDTKAILVQLDVEKESIFNEDMNRTGRKRKVAKLSTKERLAYVIFTSGSTGKPKGVEVTQRGLTNYLWFVVESQGFTDKDKFMALTTICFDISLCELFANLIRGGQVEILPTIMQRDPYLLMEKIERDWATAIQATPATWDMLVSVGWEKKLPLKIFCGGEAMSADLAAKLMPRCDELWNIYGPTEATIWSSIKHIETTDITIGHPVYNTQYYILDKHLNPVPEGTAGELYIGGDGLALGYLNRQDLTEERFIPNPFDKERSEKIYKTGDFVRFLPDGDVQWLGRIDNQVKLRGFRIELEEIESVLKQQDDIENAVVVLREDNAGFKGLYAFILVHPDQVFDKNMKLSDRLKDALPSYMIPSHYMILSHFPLTMNKKVDRKSLGLLSMDEIKEKYAVTDDEISKNQDVHIEIVENHNVQKADKNSVIEYMKKELIDLSASVLKMDKLLFDDSTPLGEYGFDSVSFTVLSIKIKEKFKFGISPAIFYTYSTINKLANYICSHYLDELPDSYKQTALKAEAVNCLDSAREPEQSLILKDAECTYNEITSSNSSAGVKEPVAVIGIGGILPMSPNLDIFWDNLVNEKDMITEVPVGRWNPFDYYGEDAKAGTGVNPIRAGFVEDVDKFDGGFFNISPREAQLMDPQQRLFIETVWKTIEDAGYRASDLSNQKIGVYVGVVATDYWDLISQNPMLMDTYTTSGIINCVIANRISYMLNLRGPSATIDTACSSSLIAIHRAVAAIQDGYCEGAIAGGVNVLANPFFHVAIGKKGMLSADGKCKTFDKDADGYVRAEGVGAILLKPLSRAEADGDHIYAVIKSSAENHGGRSNAFTVPSAEAQTELLVEAYEKAGIEPDTITYIEAHGTGTSLGDPIEINAIKDAITKMCHKEGIQTIPKRYLGVGSVKTNIGHLEAGAGVAGLLKVLLSIKHGVLPGNINFNELNPYIDIEDTPLYIVNHTKEWKRLIDNNGNVIPRRAGVSSFGFGGSNAHIAIEEYFDNKQQYLIQNSKHLIILSAKNEGRLMAYAQELVNFIKRNKEKQAYNLRDIAYTLQKGREEMDARLAIVCHSLSDLEDFLIKYINGEVDEYIFTNYIKSNKKRIELLEGEEGEAFLRSIIRNNKLSKVAELWMMGIEINWDLFYLDGKAKRVSLPTYPFEKISHWIPETKIFSEDFNDTNDILHPFIDKNVSTLEEQVYIKRLNKHDASIKDHIANSKTVFPGAAYLEMARAAGQLANRSGKVVKLQNNVWSKALILEEKPVELSISLMPQDRRVSYKIMSGEETNRQLHSQGIITYGKYEDGLNRLDLNRIKGLMLKTHTKGECYQLFAEAGFEYGSSYQGIQSLHYNHQEAFAEIELPLECKRDAGNYTLHPALLDAALQSIIVFIGNSYKESGMIFMPFAMGELEIIKPLTEKCYAYAKLTEDKQEGHYHIKKFAIGITDTDGNVLASIKDFSLRGFMATPPVKKTEDDIVAMHYMKEDWMNVSLQKASLNSMSGNIILFSNDETLFKKLNENKENTFDHVILIKSGDTYKDYNNDVYEINITNPKDYLNVFKALENRSVSPDHIIYYYLNERIDTNKEGIVSQLNSSIYSIFYMSQALTKLKSGKKTKILYLYQRDNSVGYPIYSAGKGFLKGLEIENSKVIYKAIELDAHFPHIVEGICIKELGEILPWTAKSIKYEGDNRVICQLTNVGHGSEVDFKSLPLKHEGVYIITGGVGKLGMIFGEYLARNYQARLVLVGRYPLDEDRAKRVKILEALGSEVVYLNVDISKEKDVESLIKGTRNRFGSINGIIHCAGITKDAYIINKNKADMDAVLAAKVYGTLWLDKFTADDHLDLFTMFSSVSAILGNTGQSDYAYANRFMDDFSKYRSRLVKEGKRNGHTLAIGWPYWKDGGMQLDEATERFLINTLGIHPMNSEEGIKAFEMALSLKENYILVLKGLKEKLSSVLGLKVEKRIEAKLYEPQFQNQSIHQNDGLKVDAGETEVSLIKDFDKESVIEKVINRLKSFTSEIQKLDIADVDPEADISEFGFDSITFTELSNKINGYYHISIMPSIFFEHANLMSLGEYLVKEYIDKITSVHVPEVRREQKNSNQMTKNNIAFEAISNSDSIDMPILNYVPKFRFGSSQSSTLQEMYDKQVDHQTLESKNDVMITECVQCSNKDSKEPVAIIGMSGVMPQSSDLKEFWQNIEAGKDLITEIPKERWDWQGIYGDPDYDDNKTNVKWGGFMKEVDKFDPLFFGISPKEATLMDPQQRILLENVWKAIEDSGIKPSSLSGSKTGVFVGAGAWDYLYELKENNVDIQAQTSSGVSFSILANRISYLLNLHGPSETIDTACSSSLVALHRAVEQIQEGTCELAFAGGINVMLNPAIFISLSKAGMLCEDGRCKTFDKSANGYVRGEGCGVLLLKPLSQAIKDNNQIYGVIKGSAVGHGGHANSLTTPNPIAQAETIVKAWTDAKVDPSTITYIETHGTGTSLGDPIEINGLKKAFNELYNAWNLDGFDKPYCGLGAVKTNIGHLEWGAGIAGVIKVILSMKHKKLPATLHFKEQNPYIMIEDSPFYIVDKLEAWKALKDENNQFIPRRAGVSSFGFGGVNAHIALEEYIKPDNEHPSGEKKEELLVLSAKSEERLKVYAEEMVHFIDENSVIANAPNSRHDSTFRELKIVLQKLVSEIIKVDLNELDHTESLFEYGFDLIGFEKLTDSIRDKFNLLIKSSEVVGCGTIESIARYLIDHYFNVIEPVFSNKDTIKHTKIVEYQLNLTQIAHTLKFGREEMEVRLAIVASSVDEFKYKLDQYISGDLDREVVSGNIKWSNDQLQGLLQGRSEEDFIKDAFNNNELSELGKFWVLGGKIKWSDLYNSSHFVPVSLPTYPFEKERYWVSDYAKGIKAYNNNLTHTSLHPLIGQNISNIYEQKYKTVLNQHAFYLKDHVIDGNMILPGVAYLEMAREAGALSALEPISGISDVFWAQPIIVNEEREIQLSIQPNDNNVDFEVLTINSDGSKNIHGGGKLVFSQIHPSNEVVSININNIKETCDSFITSDSTYRSFKQRGFAYGESFQAVKEIYAGDNEALARLTLPEVIEHNFEQFILHPSLMDGALQAISGIKNSNINDKLLLPFSIGELQILGTLEKEGYAYARLSEEVGSMAQIKKYHIVITDLSGKALIQIKDFILKEMTKRVSDHQEIQDYKSTWINDQVAASSMDEEYVMENKTLSSEELSRSVEEELRNILSMEINLPVSKINAYEAFEKYGVDSIVIFGLNKALEKRFGKVSKTLFFEYKNLKELSAYFLAYHKDKFIDKVKRVDINTHFNSLEKTLRFAERFSSPKGDEAVYESDIAIIGMSGRYPMADDLDAFWENLKVGKDCIIEIPKERWDNDIYFDADKNAKDKTYSKWGGFINDMDKFDPMFFGISPKDAEFMDPQERLFLQTVWHTIEDAGYTRNALIEEVVGVFVGVMYNQYPMFAAEENYKGHLTAVNSTYASVANRVSYYLDLKGPSMAVDTMCSSSLTAIHLACESIKRGDCTLAVAGGVNVSIHPNKYILLSQGKFLASDGRCRSFGDGGDGYVPGEGVGAMFLKPLKKAIEDGDRIYSVIKGSFLNHGGKTNGYSIPSPKAQGTLILDAIRRSKIDPRTISYLEAHGTGTALGDPIEMTGLLKAYDEFTTDKQFCSIGSVKSNIGHLESAAGIAGVSKVLLQMKHKQLVPSIHSDVINANIDFEDSPFYIQHRLEEWKAPTVEGKVYPRRAGISSFGAGGSNAHLILEEYIDTNEVMEGYLNDNLELSEQLILLSAKDNEGLERYVTNLINFLEGQTGHGIRLKDIAYTLQVGRENMEERLAFVASSIKETVYLLKESLKGMDENKNIVRGSYKKRKELDEIRHLVSSKELYINGRLMDIAKAWVSGDEINWKDIYKGKKTKIISLPGYPFAKERYWIEQKEDGKKLIDYKNQNTYESNLHPLIGKNISTLKEQKFMTYFTGDEYYFKHHIVNGNKMLPGAAYVEMARAAGDLSNDSKVITIKDLVWLKPIILSDGPKEINISLYPEEEYVEYTISTDTEGLERDVYSKGKIIYGNRNDNAGSETININDLKNQFNKTLSTQECYIAFNEMGIQYGNSFRVIENLMLGKKDCLARLKLANEVQGESQHYILNPYLLDGCFQAAIGVDYENKSKRFVYLPYAIEEIQIFDSLPAEVYIYVAQNDSEDDLIKRYKMTILDLHGRVLVRMINFTARAVRGSKTNKAQKVDTDKVMELLKKLYEGEVEVSEIKDMLGVLTND